MSKLNKIGYYDKETGEDLDFDMFECILKEEKKKRYKELEEKFIKGNINREELLDLMKIKNKSINPQILYDTFYKVNMNKTKPQKITDSEYGKFFQMLNFISYKNTLTYTNGKTISTDSLSKFLGFKNIRSLKNYIRKLHKNKMVAEIELGGVSYIVINPAYAQRNMRLNFTIYTLFKDDLLPFLDEYTIKLIELEEDNFEIGSIVALDP